MLINAFSFLHCNIRSVSANLDNLNHLLFELDRSFSIIGLTETKIIAISQQSLSNAGGVGFYIQDKYIFSIRTDLSKTEPGFEVLWIEIENNAHSNILCGAVYRHPHGDITNFMEYLNSSVDKIHRENKICAVMGDFNLDLLKFETHNDTDAFLNAMLTTNFQPQILQSTRITHHTATLTDNIFLISNRETFTISGNIVCI